MAYTRIDAFQNYNFLVVIDEVSQAGFQEVEGIEACIAIIEDRNGNEVNTVRKIPGVHSFSNIILRRGLTKDGKLYTWFKTVLDGKVERHTGSIAILDENRQVQIMFRFYEAWPCRLKYGGFNAKENCLAIEEIEIVIENLEVEF
jgi:phage tail-like protein